ncbi:uncharacterized protein LOC135167069 [Diachasmimorpha longicaudata]|uniref:uncharacterized protein LOC135167069 n=1 Tax=Diachasmimorpha longicaudata TaxID=58733 RepID=UPI0030B89063
MEMRLFIFLAGFAAVVMHSGEALDYGEELSSLNQSLFKLMEKLKEYAKTRKSHKVNDVVFNTHIKELREDIVKLFHDDKYKRKDVEVCREVMKSETKILRKNYHDNLKRCLRFHQPISHVGHEISIQLTAREILENNIFQIRQKRNNHQASDASLARDVKSIKIAYDTLKKNTETLINGTHNAHKEDAKIFEKCHGLTFPQFNSLLSTLKMQVLHCLAHPPPKTPSSKPSPARHSPLTSQDTSDQDLSDELGDDELIPSEELWDVTRTSNNVSPGSPADPWTILITKSQSKPTAASESTAVPREKMRKNDPKSGSDSQPSKARVALVVSTLASETDESEEVRVDANMSESKNFSAISIETADLTVVVTIKRRNSSDGRVSTNGASTHCEAAPKSFIAAHLSPPGSNPKTTMRPSHCVLSGNLTQYLLMTVITVLLIYYYHFNIHFVSTQSP